jgi:hypothetical protein
MAAACPSSFGVVVNPCFSLFETAVRLFCDQTNLFRIIIPAGGYDNEEADVQKADFLRHSFVFYFKNLYILLKMIKAYGPY